MTATENRYANFMILLAQYKDSLVELAKATGSNANHLSQIKGRTRNIGNRLARRFESKLELPKGWMDDKHTADEFDTSRAELFAMLENVPPDERPKAIAAMRGVLGIWSKPPEPS